MTKCRFPARKRGAQAAADAIGGRYRRTSDQRLRNCGLEFCRCGCGDPGFNDQRAAGVGSQPGMHVDGEHAICAGQPPLQPVAKLPRSRLQFSAAVKKSSRVTMLAVRNGLTHGVKAMTQAAHRQAQAEAVPRRW